MRTVAIVCLGLLAAAAAAGAGAPARPSHGLPASLDALYPPAADQPAYLNHMLQLGTSFSGLAADVMENDLAGARSTFEEFKSQYLEVSRMVPEWRAAFPIAPVENLGALLETGDPPRIMEAYGEVGSACHECHVATMARVQQKFHWGDFGAVTVTDPLSGKTLGFTDFKKYLSANFAGISINLKQHQLEGARRELRGFEARFEAMKAACQTCHDQEAKEYVSDDVQDLLDRLEQLFAGREVPPEALGTLLQRIGRESCAKCHLVHVPAALASAAASRARP